MVGRVEINTVPAGREEDLGSQVLGTVVVGKSVGLCVVCAEACVRNSLLLNCVCVVSQEGAAGGHAEAFRESEESFIWQGVVGIGTLEIVNQHTAVSS